LSALNNSQNTHATGNSLKFTHEGSVTVSASLSREHPKKLAVTVRDTGIGISKEKISTVFEAFNQGDMSATRQYEGTGLGLTLVKHLVEAHSGSVSVDSVLGIGTEVTFTLPLWSDDVLLQDSGIGDQGELTEDYAEPSFPSSSRSKADACSTTSSVSSKSGTTVTRIDFGLPRADGTSLSIMELRKQNLKLQADVDQLTRELARARTLAYAHGPLVTAPEGDEDTAAAEDSLRSRNKQLSRSDSGSSDALRRTAALQEELSQRDRELAELRRTVDSLKKEEVPVKSASSGIGFPSHRDVYGKFEIMSVDDNPTNQAVVSRILEPLGYVVTLCSDGQQVDVIKVIKHMSIA
jgi:hypothetical protein